MRLIAIIWIAAVVLASSSTNAQDKDPKDTLIFAAHLDKYKAPNAIESWRRLLDAKETRAVGDAITTFFDCPGCYSMVGDGINAVVPFSAEGNEYKGVVQAPAGYTVCHAVAKDPSLTCNGTLTGSYRTADDPKSAHYDGLHWYMVVAKPSGIGAGGCWVEATIVVEFIRATPGNRQRRKCPASGTIAFHYGK
jgi:hypothetical protein